MWGLIDNEFPQDEDSCDIIADAELINEIPAHPSFLEYAEKPFD